MEFGNEYIKKFENHAQYETFTASTEFVLPNVSYCKQEDEVHFNPGSEPPQPAMPITYTASRKFYVDLNAFTPAAISEDYDSTTHTGVIEFNAPVTGIGDSAFMMNQNLMSIELPNSVTTIGQNAFGTCTSLESIDIPSGVTSIGNSAFAQCINLTSITVNATEPPTLGNQPFYNTNNCTIYVPSASVNTYKTASGWSTYASRIQAMP